MSECLFSPRAIANAELIEDADTLKATTFSGGLPQFVRKDIDCQSKKCPQEVKRAVKNVLVGTSMENSCKVVVRYDQR